MKIGKICQKISLRSATVKTGLTISIVKVYTLEELTFIGQMAEKYNLLIVSDEVEQFYIYDEPQHIRIGKICVEKTCSDHAFECSYPTWSVYTNHHNH